MESVRGLVDLCDTSGLKIETVVDVLMAVLVGVSSFSPVARRAFAVIKMNE